MCGALARASFLVSRTRILFLRLLRRVLLFPVKIEAGIVGEHILVGFVGEVLDVRDEDREVLGEGEGKLKGEVLKKE